MQQPALPARYVGNSVKHSPTLGSLWLQELMCGITFLTVLVPFPLLWYNATAIKEGFNLGTHGSSRLEYMTYVGVQDSRKADMAQEQ